VTTLLNNENVSHYGVAVQEEQQVQYNINYILNLQTIQKKQEYTTRKASFVLTTEKILKSANSVSSKFVLDI